MNGYNSNFYSHMAETKAFRENIQRNESSMKYKVILISDIGTCEIDRFKTYDEAKGCFDVLDAEDKDIANIVSI